MNRTRLVLTGLAVTAAIATSGCDPQPKSEGAAASPTPAASSAAPATTAAAVATTAAANDAATVKACADIKKDIKDNAAKIAKAEKIGPPAGHFAVSAQWAAGSVAILAHAMGTTDEAVTAASEKIQNEMMGLSDAYNKSADAKPSKKALEAAIKELETACSAA